MLFAIAFFTLFIRDGYPQRIISRFSPSQQPIEYHAKHNDKAVDAWENCLNQLNVKADIVFFGDSITRRGDFATSFPDKTVCNLGMGSDTITGMTERVSMILSMSPDKLFILGGINSLRDNTLEQSIHEYNTLLSKISVNCHADTYVISVLPISSECSESIGCSPSTIKSFNTGIESMSEKYGLTFINLFPYMTDDSGFILQELTTDGVHLTDKGYRIFIDAITVYIN